jgi:hypothetical protein
VAPFAAADLEPDATEFQVEIVVDDDDVRRRHRVELCQRPDLAAGLVHVAARLGQQDRMPGQPAADDLRAGTLVRLEFRTEPRGEQVGDHESQVVPGPGVVVSGIAQADHQ